MGESELIAGDRVVGLELSLPPRVKGRVSGCLVMKVDEVLWVRQPPGEISAAVMWWGEENPTTFRPIDVSERGSFYKRTSVIYEVRTSRELFESYLKKCGSLKIAIADKFGMPIGCVNIPDICQMLKVSPFQNYYPIVNTFGNRIGDLHVSFNLRMTSPIHAIDSESPSELNESPKAKKSLKRLSDTSKKKLKSGGQNFRSQTASPIKLKPSQNSTKLKRNVVSSPKPSVQSTRSRSQFPGIKQTSLVKSELESGSKSNDNVISQILEQGRRLRDAMTHAVMEDVLQPNEITSVTERCKDTQEEVSVCYANIIRKKESSLPIPFEKERKILDYLAGKPMTVDEENEAVELLRNTTPSKDILNRVNESVNSKTQSSNLVCKSVDDMKDLPKKVDSSSSEIDSSFDLDSELLSQVNCLRISIICLMLNAIGLKRISSTTCPKQSSKASSSTLLPPGVTYFVEYQLPTSPVSRPHMSSVVRYCSKRQVGYEVRFGDRSVHNIPTLRRSSFSEQSPLASFILSLNFKVCARHLNQRVPVTLGLASPDSAISLLGSTHLRHEYTLSVISSDNLPVASLKVCLELGRDRIHFGGLFDPENNSFGVASIKESTDSVMTKDNFLSSKIGTKRSQKQISVASVTRNISKPLDSEARWKGMVSNPVGGSSSKTLKQLTSVDQVNLKKCSSEPSSAPSTQRSEMISIPNSSLPFKKQSKKKVQNIPQQRTSVFESNLKSDFELNPQNNPRNCLKHELAITIQQISGCAPLDGSATDDKDCFVSYKFPSWDASSDDAVEWNTYSTEPTVCLQDTWFRPQCRVHSVILPDTISLHVFLHESFRMRGLQSDADSTVIFSVCVRHYSEKVKDTLLAQALLPYSTLVALENAYNSAANGDPCFTDSSCASVVSDLALHFSPAYKPFGLKGAGHLKIKIDYRQVHSKQSPRYFSAPDSCGSYKSSVDVNPCINMQESNSIRTGFESQCFVDNRPPIPNWAKSPDKLSQPVWGNTTSRGKKDSYSFRNKELDLLLTNPLSHDEPIGLRASWGPALKVALKPTVSSKKGDMGVLYCTKTEGAPYRSVIDLLHVDDVPVAPINGYAKPRSTYSVSCHDLYLSGGNDALKGDETSAERVYLNSNAADKSTNPLHSASYDSRKPQPKAYHHVSTTTDGNLCETNVKSCQTSPRSVSNQSIEVKSGLLSNSCPIDVTSENSHVVPQSSGDVGPGSSQIQDEIFTSSVDIAPDPRQEHEAEIHTIDINEVQDTKEIPQFTAKIGVECALHLQSTLSDGSCSFVFVSCHPCEIPASSSEQTLSSSEKEALYVSEKVPFSSESMWNWSFDILLPADLLILAVRRLVFKIWEREANQNEEESKSSHFIGFAAVDLTVITAGLPIVCGWFNIMDFAGSCRGQIKLSVEPTEDITRLREFGNIFLESRGAARARAPAPAPAPVYLAHCAYPEFPSHVVLDSYMRVQRLPEGYQHLLQHCTKLSEDLLAHEAPVTIPLKRKQAHVDVTHDAFNTLKDSISDQVLKGGEEDPTVCLRKKLSELDIITKMMKAKLMTNYECHEDQSSSANMLPAIGTYIHQELGNEINLPSSNHELIDSENVLCSKCNYEKETCFRNMETNNQTSVVKDRQGEAGSSAPKHSCHFDSPEMLNSNLKMRCKDICESQLEPVSDTKSSVKPRKTWEKHEELIDLRSLELDSRDEEEDIVQLEEVAEWLSIPAVRHIFNPLLFHDLMNDLSLTSSNVKVVEIDDSNIESQNCSSSTDEGKENSNDSSGNPYAEDNIRRGGAGLKDLSQIFSSESQNLGGQNVFSGMDTDSGVDVDASTVFRYTTNSSGATVWENHCPRGKRKKPHNFGRMSSTSSSGISTNHHSTGPSSLSATPFGSPQRSHVEPDSIKQI